MHPDDIHPYTGKQQREYLTIVLERVPGTADSPENQHKHLSNSMISGEECAALPGYRVTAMSIGDEISQQEYEEEFGE